MQIPRKLIGPFLLLTLLLAASCHHKRGLVEYGAGGIDNRKLENGIYTLDDGTGHCAVDYPVVRLSKIHKHTVGWYSVDDKKYRVDFGTGKGPFQSSDSFTIDQGTHVKWAGALKPGASINTYYPYSVTSLETNQECKAAKPQDGDYDPGVYVTK
jgi:hypothetical protein